MKIEFYKFQFRENLSHFGKVCKLPQKTKHLKINNIYVGAYKLHFGTCLFDQNQNQN